MDLDQDKITCSAEELLKAVKHALADVHYENINRELHGTARKFERFDEQIYDMRARHSSDLSIVHLILLGICAILIYIITKL
jgi:hypothetical protein